MILNPLITIAVPVYNGENYLAEALNSIFQQDYENFEVIVVDDGSDNELSIRGIVEEFDDSRIKFFRKQNGGVASALNQVLREMNGDFLAWLSHDDLFAPNKLSIQVEALREIDSDEEILFSGYSLIGANGKKLQEIDFTEKVLDCRRLGGLERGLVNGCTILISKTILGEIGEFDETLKYTQDYDFWLRCLKAGKKFRYLPKTLVHTRQHAEQDTNKNKVPAGKEAEVLWKEIVDFWLSVDSNPIDLNIREMLEFRIFLQANGFSLAEQKLNTELLKLVSNFKISVVIPVMNRPYLLNFALMSLRSQLHSNFEVIIVDDCSRDEFDISVSCQDLSIQYIKNEFCLGAGQSRNIGIQVAKGDFICFLDSDDFFLPDKIFEQLVHMIAFNSKISHTNYFSRDSLENIYKFHDTSRHSGANQLLFISEHGCSIATPTVMLKRDLLDKVKNPFLDSHGAGEDISAWIRLIHNSEDPLLHIKLPLTIVTLHAHSAAKSDQAQKESEEAVRHSYISLGLEAFAAGSTKESRKNQYGKISYLSFNLAKQILAKLLSKSISKVYFLLPSKARKRLRNYPFLKRFYDRLEN